MKRKILIILCSIAIICLILFIILNITEKNNGSTDNNSKISMVIKEGTLTKTRATIIITDLSNKNNLYGSEFRIDKKVNGKWKELKTKEDTYFNLIGYLVDENNKIEMEQNWEERYGKLSSGKYRIVKSANDKYLTAEFEIN